MTPKTGLATALVAAIVAALVTVATLLVIWRTPPGGASTPRGPSSTTRPSSISSTIISPSTPKSWSI